MGYPEYFFQKNLDRWDFFVQMCVIVTNYVRQWEISLKNLGELLPEYGHFHHNCLQNFV
jgi:hypothetical protein